MPKDDRIAVSIKEVARLADVSPITIRREIEDGNLAAVKLRNEPLVLRESLEKALRPPKKWEATMAKDLAASDKGGKHSWKVTLNEPGMRTQFLVSWRTRLPLSKVTRFQTESRTD